MQNNIRLLALDASHTFAIHPKARPAYLFYHQIANAMPGAQDNAFALQKYLPDRQVIQGILQEDRISIFSGFEHAFFDVDTLIKTSPVILIHENINNEYIEKAAWQVTLRAVCSTKDEKWLRANFYEFAKTNLPEAVCFEYFGKRRLTKNLLARLLDIKINTLIDFIQRHKHEQ